MKISDWVIFFSIIVFTYFSFSGQYYHSELFYGLFILASLAGFCLGLKIHWSVGLLSIYILGLGVYNAFHFPSQYSIWGNHGKNYFQMFSAQGLSILLLSSLSIFLLPVKYFKYLARSIPWLCFISSTMTVWLWIFEKNTGLNPRGIMGNSSMDPSLIGVLFPSLFYLTHDKLKSNISMVLIGFFLAIISIFVSRSSNGLGAFTINIFFLLFLGYDKKIIKWVFSIFSSILIFGMACLTFHREILHDSNRFWAYQWALKWWAKYENPFFGSGLSTFWGFGPLAQLSLGKNNTTTEIFTFLHSDWLQILFETGIIGLILSILVFFFLIKKQLKKNRYWLAASLISYAGIMVFNMPLRWFWTMYSGAVLFRIGWMDENEFRAINNTIT